MPFLSFRLCLTILPPAHTSVFLSFSVQLSGAKSGFGAFAAGGEARSVEVAAGSDVSIISPYFAGSSAEALAGTSSGQGDLRGSLYGVMLNHYGGAMPQSVVNVGAFMAPPMAAPHRG